MPNPTPADVGWSLPADTVRAALGAGPQLSGAETAIRLARHGANVVAEEPEHAVWLLFRHRPASPLVLILIAGARPRSRRRRRPRRRPCAVHRSGQASSSPGQAFPANTAVRVRRNAPCPRAPAIIVDRARLAPRAACRPRRVPRS
ncbi:MAG: hypothetical protein IPI27_14395 [Betaproteobacteria bacterium]|nr:hypothetical protein [Betaproteobacteria bacterium]